MFYPPALHTIFFFALLASLFTYLYAHHHRNYFLYWASGWAILASRQVAVAALDSPTDEWIALDAFILAGAGLFILLGGMGFTGRERLHTVAVVIFGVALGVLAALALIAMASLAPGLGPYLATGLGVLVAGWIGAGWLIHRNGREEAPIGAPLAGLSLLAWGTWVPVAVVLDARIDTGLWPVTIDAALGALVVVGMVILALEGGRVRISERTDLTARRRAEAEVNRVNGELMRMNEKLERANRLQSEFLSNTTHELKTPLTSIMANIEILEYEMCGPINDEQRRVLSNISRNSQHLLEMISRLLDFARQREGVATLRVEEVDPREILAGVAETVQPLLDEKQLHLEIRIDPELGNCWLDGEKIYRVYLNLIENAIKFSPQGIIRARAGLIDGEFEGSVVDQGIGIPADRLGDIFQAFTQVDASSTRPYPGVGLGLAICRQLVELHGGRIWAESEPGKGSTFRFRVPCEPSSAAVAVASVEAGDAV